MKSIKTIPETVSLLTLNGMNIISATRALKSAILNSNVNVFIVEDKFYVCYEDVVLALKGGAA